MGLLVKDSDIDRKTFHRYFRKTGLKVAVGDRTTERITEFGFSPNLEIIDKIERRLPRAPIKLESSQEVIRATNKPGTISSDALEKLDESLSLILQDKRTVRLVIEGEEDLLALPVTAFYPEHTFVFYGQPGEGLVVVDVSVSRQRAKDMLAKMGIMSLKTS
jgi:GTP-dependent dephospho-CoA kinase